LTLVTKVEMAAEVLSWSGLALSLIGTAIAALGISQTWRQFHPAGARFWGPFYDWADRRLRQPARSFGRATKLRWNRMLGTVEPRSTTVKVGQAIETDSVMSATVRLSDSESVDPNDAEAFYAYVRKRLATLRAHVQRLDEDINHERTLRGAAIDRLSRDVAVEHDRLRETAQLVAISGLPLEMTGIFFVLVGTVLQAIAQFIR
jgi:hypothetical protein